MGWGDGESESFWILEQIIIITFLEIMIDGTLFDIWKRP